MKKLSLLVSFVAFAAIAVPSFAQVNDTQIIPAVADTSGANGTRWATEFHLFNPQATPLKVRLIFLPTGGTAGSRVDFTVAANETVYADNLLRDVFNLSGTGALLVATFPEDNPSVPNTVLDRSFLVTTKTFNNASSGTFGQTIPGNWVGLQDFASDGISAVAVGVRNTSSAINGYRANVGAVNLGRYTATLEISVYDRTGKTLANHVPFILPPQGHFQDSLPVGVDHGSVEFFVRDANKDAVVFPYVSVIDNKSGDPTYLSPVLLASAGSLYKKLPPQSLGTPISSATARQLSEHAIWRGDAVVLNGTLTRQ